MTDLTLSMAAAESWVADAFARHGASRTVAQSVARALVAAEADGLKGHGLQRLPTYLAMLKTGKARGDAEPTMLRPKPGTLLIDACDGFAYPAIDMAIAALPETAHVQGIAAAAITRSSHCGAAGHHVEALAAKGLVALLFANTPAAMAPWGGKAAPVVVDLALSKVARGNLVAARQKGETIPDDWALDPDGNPTTDPAKGIAGTMLPLGGAKGAALAFMVEVLAAAIVGTHLSFEASSFLDGDGGPPRTGQLIIAIDPSGFGHGAFAERMTTMAAAIEAQAGARLSGMRRLKLREAARANGILLPKLLQEQVAAA
jgi:(2R)-3-sulfolactate dehydrogenase (NADP+)